MRRAPTPAPAADEVEADGLDHAVAAPLAATARLPAGRLRIPRVTTGRFGSLPHAVQVQIFGLLPLDTRLRCIEVCRAWRLALLDASAWKHLTLPDFEFTGVNALRLFGLAVAYAQGQLETLDVSNSIAPDNGFLDRTIFDSDTAAQPRLRELRLGALDFRDSDEILHILEKAPQLQLLAVASAWSHFYDRAGNQLAVVDELYRGAVRIRTLGLDFELDGMDDDELQALFTRIRHVVRELTHPDFTALYVDFDIMNAKIVELVADLAAEHEPPLLVLGLEQFDDWPEMCFDTTIRLLRLNTLRHFDTSFWLKHLGRDGREIDDEDEDAVWSGICSALRDCTSLHTVVLDPLLAHAMSRDWRWLTAALAGHTSIARIVLHDEEEDEFNHLDCVVYRSSLNYGRGLAEIIAANAPALRRLRVCESALEQDGLKLLLSALARNTHLKQLAFGNYTSWGQFCEPDNYPQATRPLQCLEFVDKWLMPSVRQNRSLRELDIEDAGLYDEDDAVDDDELEDKKVCLALQAAQALVRDRSDPKVLAAARDWQRAYRRWTTPRTQP